MATVLKDLQSGKTWNSDDFGGNVGQMYNVGNAFTQQQTEEQRKAAELAKRREYMANDLSSEAQKFRENLPTYTGNQIESAGSQARMNLANDLANVKQNSNARGLLYSGIQEGNQNKTRAMESSNLGAKIQDINKSANSMADYKDQLATSAQAGVDMGDVNWANIQSQQQQQSYTLALQEQQNRQNFFSNLFGNVAGIGAAAALKMGGL